MKVRLIELAIVACGAAIGFMPALVPSTPQPAVACVRDVQLPPTLRNTWKVQTQGGSGSAWPINSTTLATARHVVQNKPVLFLKNPAGEVLLPAVVYLSDDLDVAFITVFGELTPMKLAARTLNPGDLVRAFGYPFGDHPAVSQGIVFGWITGEDVMVIDCGVIPGMSGGPVVNGAGEVVSLIMSCTRPPGRSMGLTLPIERVLDELEQVRNAGRSTD